MLRLYKFFKPFSLMIAGVLIFVFFQTLADLYLPTLMSDIINKGVMMGDTAEIIRIGGTMLLVTGAGAICAFIMSYLSAKAAMGFGRNLRNAVFRRVESYSLNEFYKFGTSTLITRTTNDITQVQMVSVMIMRMMVSAPMMVIGGFILALRQDRQLTWVLAVAVPILAAVVILLASQVIPLFKLVQLKLDRLNLILREKLTGVRVIRAFGTTAYERSRFENANEDLTQNY
ncbi:MAG TPA: ABC transporter permease, partial [Clostridia bacterium]|nr:ABC transporter permease [Clostridia bacterium]